MLVAPLGVDPGKVGAQGLRTVGVTFPDNAGKLRILGDGDRGQLLDRDMERRVLEVKVRAGTSKSKAS